MGFSQRNDVFRSAKSALRQFFSFLFPDGTALIQTLWIWGLWMIIQRLGEASFLLILTFILSRSGARLQEIEETFFAFRTPATALIGVGTFLFFLAFKADGRGRVARRLSDFSQSLPEIGLFLKGLSSAGLLQSLIWASLVVLGWAHPNGWKPTGDEEWVIFVSIVRIVGISFWTGLLVLFLRNDSYFKLQSTSGTFKASLYTAILFGLSHALTFRTPLLLTGVLSVFWFVFCFRKDPYTASSLIGFFLGTTWVGSLVLPWRWLDGNALLPEYGSLAQASFSPEMTPILTQPWGPATTAPALLLLGAWAIFSYAKQD